VRVLLFASGRVFGRGLIAFALVALCLVGLAQLAAGAMIPAKAVAAQILLERAFDRSIALHHAQKPWPWADMAPVARIRVPRLGVDRIVLDTGSGQAMAFGPTLLPGGARLGDPGVTVIAAHRDTHFRFLRSLRRGDIVVVEGVDGTSRRYHVTGSEVVRWDRFAIGQGNPANELALATCYPFDAIRHGPLRYVVHAIPLI
jgi:sortase A